MPNFVAGLRVQLLNNIKYSPAMDLMQGHYCCAAKADKQRIVLPEGTEERTS